MHIIKLTSFYFVLFSLFNFCSQSENKSTESHCDIILPEAAPNNEVDIDLINKEELPPSFLEQKTALKQFSHEPDTVLHPDGKYLFGRFDCGVIEIKVSEVDGEPWSVYGFAEGVERELEFLMFGISNEVAEEIQNGEKYKIYWMETICFMEPFDHGYQRRYIVYRVE